MSPKPIRCIWDGESFTPSSPRWAREADKQFVVGEPYSIAPYEERSDVSHRHEFAFINEAWKTLPEQYVDLFPTANHLRKRSLIRAGYYNEEIIDVGTKAGALRVAAYVRGRDDFAYVVVRGTVVVVRTAKSQARKVMNRKEFQESKQAVLEIVSEMIGVPHQTLAAEAGRAA